MHRSQTNRQMGFRLREQMALAKVEAGLLRGARQYLESAGFVEIDVPRITTATGSCENIDTLFEMNYFGRRAYLIQTAQLFLEILVSSLGKVWCYGPSFRAEPRVDRRHLTQFALLEVEFLGDFEAMLTHIENLIAEMFRGAFRYAEKELKEMGIDRSRIEILTKPFARVTYDEAVRVVKTKWGDDLTSSHERTLVESFGNQPLFVTHFPTHFKFFNMRTNPDNPRIVNSADLILSYGGEAVGAAEREFEYEKVLAKLKGSRMMSQLQRAGGGIEEFGWYLDHLRWNGSAPHAGFGVGVARVMQSLLCRNDIRRCIPFPSNKVALM